MLSASTPCRAEWDGGASTPQRHFFHGATMSAITRGDFRSVPYLLGLGGVTAATAAVFYVVAFLWLGLSHPAAPPGDPLPPTRTLEANEGQPPEAGNTARSLSAGGPVHDIATVTPAAPPNRYALAAAPIKKALSLPARKTHAKTTKIRRHRQYQMTITRLPQRETARSALGFVPTTRTAVWRPDASVGPNPGGGFYGPPNSEVGHINPG
jgi:hypothetical protein